MLVFGFIYIEFVGVNLDIPGTYQYGGESQGDHEGHPWMSHINNVEFLLAQKDFDINFTYYGQTPLWIACSLGILGCVTQLAEAPFVGGEPNPIDLEKPSSAGETPLYAACRAGHVKVAQYLVERVSKACLDAPTLDARTPLWIAAHNGHAAVVELLCSLKEEKPGQPPPIAFEYVVPGARNLQRFGGGTSASQAAQANGHDEIVKLLESAITQQRAAKARAKLKKSQQLVRANVRMRDADGVFFGPDNTKLTGSIGRVTRALGNEQGIDYITGMKERDMDEEDEAPAAPVGEMIDPQQVRKKKKKKKGVGN